MPAAEHPDLPLQASPDTAIWRYVDFTKLVSMLETSRLYFARVDKLEDAWEGAYPKETARLFKQMLGDQEIGGTLQKINRMMRGTVFVNCWHQNQYESAAMWRVYTRTNESVAIRSSVSRLKQALQADQRTIYLASIQYIDYENASAALSNTLTPFVWKRKSFEFEREVRAVLWDSDSISGVFDGQAGTPGLSVRIDLNALVSAIHIAPSAPGWFLDLVRDVLRRYSLNVEVSQSLLDSRPLT